MVPAECLALHKYHGEYGKDDKSDDLLNHLKLPEREWASVLCTSEAICRDLEAVPQLRSTMAAMPNFSIFDLKTMCPYHAKVIKALEQTSSRMAKNPFIYLSKVKFSGANILL